MTVRLVGGRRGYDGVGSVPGPPVARPPAGRIIAAVAAAMIVVSCGPGPYRPLTAPERSTTTGPATTSTLDPAAITLPTVGGGGATGEVPLGPGPLTFTGTVQGPEGPVPGATVRAERFVGTRSAGVDLLTGPEGTFELAGVLGGVWRFRAWRAPDLAMPRALVAYVRVDEPPGPLVLGTERVGGRLAVASTNPQPARPDEPATIAVRITDQRVTDDGIITAEPVANLAVRVVSAPGWRIVGPAQGLTDGSGTIVFDVVCTRAGAAAITLATADGDALTVDVPPCEEPPPPPTGASPTTGPADGT